jgi:hypothetical protein
MITEAWRGLRVTGLVMRALVHIAFRPYPKPQSVASVIADANRLAATLPGNELKVVLFCDYCQSVAIVDYKVGEVRVRYQVKQCPIPIAWRELIRRPLPRATQL